MTDPYNWPFPQKTETMYLSSIGNNDKPFAGKSYMRDSTFQWHDIGGAQPKNLVSPKKRQDTFMLSTFVQPKPQCTRKRSQITDPMKIDDIEGTRPKAHEFRTRRVVDPLAPKYQLASCSAFSVDQGKKFVRDTLIIDDIVEKKKKLLPGQQPKEPVLGSAPMARTKNFNAVNRLEVKDINKDGIFQSTRTTNPLQPNYDWRDDQMNKEIVNHSYGNINGANVKKVHPSTVNRKNDLSLNNKDIDGSSAGSFFHRTHFLDKRREFRDYMNTKNIEKADPGSLKKGIVTKRETNPLMPSYQFLGNKEVQKTSVI